jgi:hypothetical protein
MQKDIEKSPLVQSLIESSYTRQIVQAFEGDERFSNSQGPD